LARTRWQQNPSYKAASLLKTALRIREEENDRWGLNVSYMHLADYYTASHPDSALYYAQQMYAVARELKSPDDRLEALERLIVLSPAKALKNYFNAYHFLSDSIQTARNTAKNQFALIRYEAEKSKADNLLLQQENTEREMQLLVLGLSFVFLTIVAWLWQRKREQQQKLKARNDLQEQKLNTARKLHDTIANGLYRLMAGLEHEETMSKETLLDNIEKLYEQSRDISYEQSRDISHKQSTAASLSFHRTIANLVHQFAGTATNLSIAGNHAATWAGLNDQQQSALYEIVQEMLVNMKKHAQAKFVVLKFEREERQLHLQYTDDGIGLPETVIYGNGLTNTENRIRAMGGGISFGRSVAGGLKIHLHFPIV
ncbi:MAG: ATP-binding protein, partial [Flavihumibacter sp.]